MKIWLINNYNMLPEHGHLNRNYYLGKYLKRLGHEPIAFAGSHPHNSNLQLIEGNEKYRIYREEPFQWVLVKICNYEGSKKKRVLSMLEFYWNMKKITKHFAKPDVIIGSSAHPLAALLAIKLGKKYGCKGIVEVRDLWPESIVAYGIASKSNPVIKFLYRFEKYLYMHADSVIFTMENAYQYIQEQGWDKDIPRTKVYYLNNGIDLEEYKQNLEENPFVDDDLSDDSHFKVVYAGSIRKVNNIGILLDAAKLVKNDKIRFLVWGDGDELQQLKKRVENEKITNFVLKGKTEKKYIASITSQADINIMHGSSSPIMKFGLSANKLFDYAAGGKPILTDFKCNMNPAENYHAGVSIKEQTPQAIASILDKISQMRDLEYGSYCKSAIQLSLDYSFENLAKKMIKIIES